METMKLRRVANSEKPEYYVYAVWEPNDMVRPRDIYNKFKAYATVTSESILDESENHIEVLFTCKIGGEMTASFLLVIHREYIEAPAVPEDVLIPSMLYVFHYIKSVARDFSVIVKSNRGDAIAISV